MPLPSHGPCVPVHCNWFVVKFSSPSSVGIHFKTKSVGLHFSIPSLTPMIHMFCHLDLKTRWSTRSLSNLVFSVHIKH